MNVAFQKAEYYLTLASDSVDPIAIQNIILGCLILLVFVGELVHRDKTHNDSKSSKSEFHRMILSYKVLNIISVAFLTLSALTFSIFAYFLEGPWQLALLSTITLCVLAILFNKLCTVQNWINGKRLDLEVSFLKSKAEQSLSYRLFCFGRNNDKDSYESQIRAWESFWSEKTSYDEEKFTEIFADQVDIHIKKNKIDSARRLSEVYLENIDKRGVYSITEKLLPRVLKWSTDLSSDYFFGDMFFASIEENVLKNARFNNIHAYLFFSSENGLIKYIGDDKSRADVLIPIFMRTVLNKKLFENDAIFIKDGFPDAWKITSENSHSKSNAFTILNEVISWIERPKPKIFKNSETSFDQGISRLFGGIFPSVDSIFFKDFLMLYFASRMPYSSDDGYVRNLVKVTLREEENFVISNSVTTWSSVDESDIEERMDRLFETQRVETVAVIDGFFMNTWPPVFEDDLVDIEGSSRLEKIINVRLKKLNDIKDELHSAPESSKQKRLLELLDMVLIKYKQRIDN